MAAAPVTCLAVQPVVVTLFITATCMQCTSDFSNSCAKSSQIQTSSTSCKTDALAPTECISFSRNEQAYTSSYRIWDLDWEDQTWVNSLKRRIYPL
ncbi:hypothetical protein E2562_007316 [Oryza meyeriana var. granulata]|uniref:Uncharacterized protein n=1 Tax=Oryza meyeriana var. granulata TaxID=110450 RepID=A0A6G1D190_9ORYZ|nr:hypothetical protein E2562_007316 [Oryza meyeriana var. granulata]